MRALVFRWLNLPLAIGNMSLFIILLAHGYFSWILLSGAAATTIGFSYKPVVKVNRPDYAAIRAMELDIYGTTFPCDGAPDPAGLKGRPLAASVISGYNVNCQLGAVDTDKSKPTVWEHGGHVWIDEPHRPSYSLPGKGYEITGGYDPSDTYNIIEGEGME